MTEPVMNPVEQDRLTKEVGRAMVRVAGQHWQRIQASYRSAGRHVEADLVVLGADGQEHVIRPPGEVVSGFARLRGGMYRPGRGTWIAAKYSIEPTGTFEVEFEPDVEPEWRRVPPPIGFMDELRFFPRSEEHIPDWLRARAGMPPAVSAETQAAHTPPGGLPVQQPGGAPAQQPVPPAPQGGPQVPPGPPVQQPVPPAPQVPPVPPHPAGPPTQQPIPPGTPPGGFRPGPPPPGGVPGHPGQPMPHRGGPPPGPAYPPMGQRPPFPQGPR
ncbi:hypothetical protein [Actinokineospora sp. HUAS TT18]|uniref:hypothetical protein n=1 Tax=Actinokineospora sp. HUAS TT18 TaxID=3447451 RepID=UPI003F524CFC